MKICREALCWLALIVFAYAPGVRADVGIALFDPTHVGAERWTQTGHSGLYLSGVCENSPIELRLCGHREHGFYVLHFSQQPGVAERCGTARAGTEMAFHEPKYMLPAILIGDHEVAG